MSKGTFNMLFDLKIMFDINSSVCSSINTSKIYSKCHTKIDVLYIGIE